MFQGVGKSVTGRPLSYQGRIEPPKAARGHVTPQTALSKSLLFLEITCYIVYFISTARAALAR